MTPKILGIDIESLPGEAYIWRLGKQYVGLPQLKRPARVCMIGAKWIGTREPVIVYDERGRGKDLGMMQRAHALICKADAVVTYNGDGFDLPWLRGAMAEYELAPLPPVISIDLYKTVRKFRLMSNKLAYVAPLLQI